MSDAIAARLLAEPSAVERLSHAHGVLFLVGGYDGSGNYGDVMQLVAGLGLAERLGESVVAMTVVEHEHRASHADLVQASPELARSPTCFFATGETAPDELVALTLPAGLAFTGLYLSGGGYLNATWGQRKLTTIAVLDDLVRSAALPPLTVIASGLQADGQWLLGLAEDELALLRRARVFGVRDRQSLRGVRAAGIDAVFTGDDIVGVVADHAGAPRTPRASPTARLRVNLHMQTGDWVTSDADALRRFILDVLSALERECDGPAEIVPVVAYADRRIDERPLLSALAQDVSMQARQVHDPVGLRPSGLAAGLGLMAQADLTLTCSYHVALTSLLLGVPAALIAGNPYYAQKAAGLREQFGLAGTFTLHPADDPAAVSRRLAGALLPAEARAAVDRELSAGAAKAVRVRRTAELEILSRVAVDIGDALARRLDLLDSRAPGPDAGVAQLTERLATLRSDYQELVAGGRRARTALAAQRAQLDELKRRLEVVYGSRSWQMTAPLRRLGGMLRRSARHRRHAWRGSR